MGQKIVGVITARMTSRRLPGKVMKYLAGKTVFAHHVERMKAVEGLHRVYLATSAEPENESLIAEARSLGIEVHAGAVEDVLARHITIAEIEHADAVLRITCDCPVFSIETASEMVSSFDGEDLVYVSNMTMIQGTLGEVISTQALLRSHEHYHGPAISQFIRKNLNLFQLRAVLMAEYLCRPEYRLALDYPADLELFECIYTNLYQGWPIPLVEVYRFLDDNPEIAALNAHVEVKNVNLYGNGLLTRPAFSVYVSNGVLMVFNDRMQCVPLGNFISLLQIEERKMLDNRSEAAIGQEA